MRRTKVLATMGPATEQPEVLRTLIQKGLNAVRCNFSHGSAADHQKRVELVRRIAREEGKVVAVLGDLQGPKIRIARFKNNKINVKAGEEFILDAKLGADEGDETRVGIDYKELPKDVKSGDILLLDDGKIELKVKHVKGEKVFCEVLTDGVLSNNKGINKLGGGLTAPALTDKDREDIETAARLKMDYVAVSFVRHAADMEEARGLLRKAGSEAWLVAKIERAEAMDELDGIIKASDAVMVARGDLAVEIGDAAVPAAQKRIIQRARDLDTIVITATQMMESMIESPSPTRAEVSDVANAVLDGTDVVMLSAETATGRYPVKVLEAMNRVCEAAEQYPEACFSEYRVEHTFKRVDEAIAMASMYTANHLHVKAIACLTESGATPLWMSRINSLLPIFALTRNLETIHRMALVRGVVPIHFDPTRMPYDYVNRSAIDELVRHKAVTDGDLVLVTTGDHMGMHGGTNKMMIVTVGRVA